MVSLAIKARDVVLAVQILLENGAVARMQAALRTIHANYKSNKHLVDRIEPSHSPVIYIYITTLNTFNKLLLYGVGLQEHNTCQ